MYFKKFRKKDLDNIIKNIFQGNRIQAITEYRALSPELSGDELILDLIEIAKKASTTFLKSKVDIPEKCCLNCIGTCGNFIEKTKNKGFSLETFKLNGTDCSNFKSPLSFINYHDKECTVVSLIKNGNVKAFTINNNFLSIKVNDKYKVFIGNKASFLNHILKLLKINYGLAFQKEEKNVSFKINEIEPNSKETYIEYFNRCHSEIRERAKEQENLIVNYSYAEACEKLKEKFNKKEVKLIDSIGMEEFLNMYYPETSVWDVLISLSK